MKLLILGGGESGAGAAKLGKKLGMDVFVSDSGMIKDIYRTALSGLGVHWEEGGHSDEFLNGASLVVKSPGIPDSSNAIQRLISQKIEVISEIEFASRHTKAKMIGITGTNGKTTTTLLTHHILEKAGFDVAVAGNVGTSFSGLLADKDREYFVLEISSFQLDNVSTFKPDIAVLLNITPDHLDRYEYSLERYANAKMAITASQDSSNHFIYNADDEFIAAAMERSSVSAQLHPISISREVRDGAWLNNDQIEINITDKPFQMSIHELALQGKHNAYNSMAASVAARIFEIRKEIVRDSLCDFQNIEHRLEFVAQIHGIQFINDSKATNVNSTWYALESISEPVVWIVGGVDKGNDYSILEGLVKEKVKAIVCLGKDNKKLIEFFGALVPEIVEVESAQDAVNSAYRFARKGDAVLLSPACASFDLFDNYEDRGQQYKRAVRAL